MVKQHAYDSLQGQLDEKTIDSPSEMGYAFPFLGFSPGDWS